MAKKEKEPKVCNGGYAHDFTVCVVTRVTSPVGGKHNSQHLLSCIHMKKIAKMVQSHFAMDCTNRL